MDVFGGSLECFLCKETFKKPVKMLPCLHSFCGGCLDGFLINNLKDKAFSCPQCKKSLTLPNSGSDGFTEDCCVHQSLDKKQRAEDNDDNSTKCDHCLQRSSSSSGRSKRKADAVARCVDCQSFICDRHRRKHNQHTMIELGKKENENDLDENNVPPVLCSKHPGSECETFCEQCQDVVCQICLQASETHSSHSLKPLQQLAHQERVNIETLRERLITKVLEKRKQEMQESQLRHLEITSLIEREEEKIHSVFESLKKQLDCQRDKLIKELRGVGLKKAQSIAKISEELEENVKAIEDGCRVADTLVHMASDIDLLTMNTTVSSRLNELDRYSFEAPRKEDFGVDFDFVQELEFVSSFGRVFDLKGISLIGLTVTGSGIGGKIQSGQQMSFTITLKDLNVQQLVEDIKVEAVFEGPAEVQPVVVNNLDGSFTILYSLDIPGTYSIYVFVENNLIEQCPFIVQTRTYEHSTLVWKHFKTIGAEGTTTGQFKHPIGAAVHPVDGRIFISDERNHRVQVFDRAGDFVSAFGSFGSGPACLSDPMGIAFMPNKNAIVVCEYNSCRIHLFDENGGNLRTFGSKGTGPSQFMNPWGVTTDSNDRIYICDFNNHRVQV